MNGCSARGPQRVDHARGELLAAAGFAVDEHRRLALGEALDQVADLHHRRRFAEQLVARHRLRLLRHLERLLDERAQLLERDRLREVVERAGLERRDRVLGAAVRGDHGDGNVEPFLVDVLDDAQALAVGQAHVGEAEVERLLVEEPDRFADRFGARRVESHPRQRELEQLEQIGLVVDDEHFGLTADSAGHGSPSLSCAVGMCDDPRASSSCGNAHPDPAAGARARRRWRRRARAQCTGRGRCRRGAS